MSLLTNALHRAFGTQPRTVIVSDDAAIRDEGRHPERAKRVEGPPYSAGQPHSRIGTALHKIPLWLQLFIGTAALAVLTFFWLGIPDSHIWQLAFSLITAIVIGVAALALYANAIRRVRTATTTPLWLSILLLAGWLLVCWALVHAINRIDPGIYERAGYWNSKLSASMRATLTYARLIDWQKDFELILTWVVLPALLLPFIIETMSRGLGRPAWSNAAHTLRHWQHWITVIILGHLGLWLTNNLIHWHPAQSVSGELLSAALRLGLIYLLDIVLFLLVLGVDSELLSRSQVAAE